MTNAIGNAGTTGLTGVTGVTLNRAAQAWNGSAYVTYVQASLATYKNAAAEHAPLGAYVMAIPSGAQADWWMVIFLDSTNNPIASCVNPSITDAALATGSMLLAAAARLGGATPTRTVATGEEVYRDRANNVVLRETNSTNGVTETATRTFS